jgi:hypothetical protein
MKRIGVGWKQDREYSQPVPSVTNGETHFESRGFTDDYQADYISVQCLDDPEPGV